MALFGVIREFLSKILSYDTSRSLILHGTHCIIPTNNISRNFPIFHRTTINEYVLFII